MTTNTYKIRDGLNLVAERVQIATFEKNVVQIGNQTITNFIRSPVLYEVSLKLEISSEEIFTLSNVYAWRTIQNSSYIMFYTLTSEKYVEGEVIITSKQINSNTISTDVKRVESQQSPHF